MSLAIQYKCCLKIQPNGSGMMAHVYNSSYLGERDRITVQGQPWQKCKTISEKTKQNKNNTEREEV
jgi:hypothetical protein